MGTPLDCRWRGHRTGHNLRSPSTSLMLSAKEHNTDKTKAGSGDPALHHRSPLKTSLLPKMAGAIL